MSAPETPLRPVRTPLPPCRARATRAAPAAAARRRASARRRLLPTPAAGVARLLFPECPQISQMDEDEEHARHRPILRLNLVRNSRSSRALAARPPAARG